MTRRNRVAGLVAVLAVLAAARATAQADTGRIVGTVTDSVHAQPLAGAVVIATPVTTVRDSVFHSAQVGSDGRFALGGLRSGRYTLSVEHLSIDSTGIGAPPVEVLVVSGAGAAVATLAIPSVPTLRRVLCPTSRDTATGVMIGAVMHTDGRPIKSATIVFFWEDFDVDQGSLKLTTRQLNARATTDDQGVYRACGLPIERSLFVQAQAGIEEQSGVLEEQIGEIGVLVRDFRVSRHVVTRVTATTPDSLVTLGANVLVGRIHDTDEHPVASAQITLLGTVRVASTNAAGAFRLTGLPGGTQGIEVLALGYYPRRIRVELGDDTRTIDIRLERVAVVLDSMRVIAMRTKNPNRRANHEFEQRASVGNGYFMSEREIEAKHPLETADLFRSAPGVQVFEPRADSAILVSTRGRTTFQSQEQFGRCVLDVFIDGQKANPTDVNLLSPRVLRGIEVHSVASAPPRYHVSQCGAVFFWTK